MWKTRVETSIVQSVYSSGKCRKILAWQILQKSLKWQILAFMNKIKLKTCEIKKLTTLFCKKITLESITNLICIYLLLCNYRSDKSV